MAFEGTRQKLAQERKTLLKRFVLAGVAGALGLALGVSMYDVDSVWGVSSASALAVCTGFGAFYLVGYLGRRS